MGTCRQLIPVPNCRRRKDFAWIPSWGRTLGSGLLLCALVMPLAGCGDQGELVGHASAAEAVSSVAPVIFPTERADLLQVNGQHRPLMLEIARSREQRERGLMFRTSLAEGHGMLFVDRQPAVIRMWMKNTLIPLDMVFFDQSGTAVYTIENAKPGDLTPIGPPMPVSAVLELPAGQVKHWGIVVGDRLDSPLFPIRGN